MANRIKYFRKNQGLTIQELSRELDKKGLHISTSSISKYERGERNPKIEQWTKLSKFFGVSINELKKSQPN